jgi:hypothetical protein
MDEYTALEREAERLGVDVSTILEWVVDGHIPRGKRIRLAEVILKELRAKAGRSALETKLLRIEARLARLTIKKLHLETRRSPTVDVVKLIPIARNGRRIG